VKEKLFLHINLIITLLLFVPFIKAQDKMFTVVIDAGHGGKDPGARGATINEKVINLSVALKVGKLISDNHKDVKVIYTRKTDVFVELDERANIANRNKADLFISIHANAVKRKNVTGTETFTLGLARTEENLEVAKRENSAILLEDDYLQKYEGFDPNSAESYIIFEFMQNKHMEQSISLASEIQKSFSSAKREDRGVKQAGLLVLRKTSMPSVLVELGFITNREEERYMKSANGQNALAKAIYDAFAKYKREYDKRQGAPVNSSGVKPASPPVKPAVNDPIAPIEEETNQTPAKGQIVYKVQILTSGKKLPSNSRQFKGYKDIDFYIENGIYKYTYGATTDPNKIKSIRKNILKDFKDAFIVEFRDGKRIK